MNENTNAFIHLARHPVKFRMFLFSKLPSAYFSGVRIKTITPEHCDVTVPYKWFSQNPFRSTYFACLGMAAELSTGALAMAHSYKSAPPISMLVTKIEAEFSKKAVGITTFTCIDGALIKQAIQEAIINGESRSIKAKATGKNNSDELIAEFYFGWSFKAKSKQNA